jgi:acyl-CoA synthetase (AMP-forming)/AMP-acid ligase II
VTNFAQELVVAAADVPERPAVKLDDRTLSYGALEGAVALTAGALRARGVRVGDRVGMQLPNVPYFPIAYYAVMRLGAVVVPLNPLLKGDEVAAAVVMKHGEQATPDELRDFVKSRIAGYKYPRVVWFMDELPKGPTGKILKREITVPDGASAEEQEAPRWSTRSRPTIRRKPPGGPPSRWPRTCRRTRRAPRPPPRVLIPHTPRMLRPDC